MGRAAVVEHECRARREPAHQPIPHHPAASRVIEQAVAALDVGVQQMLLLMLQQRAARAVHDALGHPGGARRIKDVERMIERCRDAAERHVSCAERLPARRPGSGRAQPFELRLAARVGDDDDPLDTRKLRQHLRHRRERVECLTRVEVAVSGEQHPRCDLTEPVEHPVHAEVRRARGPGCPQARRCEHGDGGLGKIGQEAGNPVAGNDAGRLEPVSNTRDLRMQLPV